MRTVPVRWPEDLLDKVDAAARAEGLTRSEFIRAACEARLPKPCPHEDTFYTALDRYCYDCGQRVDTP